MQRFSQSSFGIRDLSKENHWLNDILGFKINKPTFICFGGNGTLNSKKANGQASRVERLMGLKPFSDELFGTYKNIDVISFYYGRDKKDDTFGKLTIEESVKFIKQLFLPLCVNLETNKRLPQAECCKNFSQIIFSSFCYGTQCINDMLYDFATILKGYGFSQKDIMQIYSHSFHIAYSPYMSDEFLPFMQINSFQDSYNKLFEADEIFEKQFGYKLNGIKLHKDKKYQYKHISNKAILPNQKEINIYTSKLVNTTDNMGPDGVDEHSSAYVDLEQDWSAAKASNQAKNSECISKISGYALAYAGARALNIKREMQEVEPFDLDVLADASQSILEGFSEEELKSK